MHWEQTNVRVWVRVCLRDPDRLWPYRGCCHFSLAQRSTGGISGHLLQIVKWTFHSHGCVISTMRVCTRPVTISFYPNPVRYLNSISFSNSLPFSRRLSFCVLVSVLFQIYMLQGRTLLSSSSLSLQGSGIEHSMAVLLALGEEEL